MSDPAAPAPESRKIEQIVEKTAASVRQRPVKSVVWAFFIGIFLTIFPVGRILGGIVSVVLLLLRPVLMLLGVVKLFEAIEQRKK